MTRALEDWLAAIKPLHRRDASVSFGIIDRQLVVAGTPLPRASAAMPELIAKLIAHRVERISITRGVTEREAAAS